MSTDAKPQQPDPLTPATRRDYTFRIFRHTWGLLGASPLGRMTVNPEEWLAREAPELLAKIEAAKVAAYKASDDYCAMKLDTATFKAAGKAWRDAWLEAGKLAEAKGVVGPLQPPAPPPPPPPKPEDPFAKPPCSGCGRTNWVATFLFDSDARDGGSRYCHKCMETPKQATT